MGKAKEITEVERIIIVSEGGAHYPVFVGKNGKKYTPIFTATGSCWMISWQPETISDEINGRG